jgi:prophage DNA circulation protein
MAWEDTLLDATFRGVVFDVLRTKDSTQRDTVSHEYPYLDGADIEDLGRKARRFSLTAVFWGDDYETRLQDFVAVLDKPGPGELIHPVFGSIEMAQLLDYEIDHDAENRDYCTVDLKFSEATPGNPFFVRSLPARQGEAVKTIADEARSGIAGAFAGAVSGLKMLKGGLARINAFRSMVTGTIGSFRQLVRGYVTTALDILDYPRAFCADLTGLVSGLVDLRSFDSDPMAAFSGLAGQLDQVVLLPAQQGQSTVQGNASGTGANSLSNMVANAADIALLTTQLKSEFALALAEVAGEILAAQYDAPTLSPTEIEHVANTVRQLLQAAIDSQRQQYEQAQVDARVNNTGSTYAPETYRAVIESLRKTASLIQEAAQTVIVLRPPLIQKTVESPGNLHLVAHYWYGDYTRAIELLRLNPQCRNPNFIAAGEVLNAYSH